MQGNCRFCHDALGITVTYSVLTGRENPKLMRHWQSWSNSDETAEVDERFADLHEQL
jgi:hypothetical protein